MCVCVCKWVWVGVSTCLRILAGEVNSGNHSRRATRMCNDGSSPVYSERASAPKGH